MSHLQLLPQLGHFIRDAYEDFLLRWQAMLCTDSTIQFYRHTLGEFIDWLPDSGLEKPSGISPSHIRTYPAGLTSRIHSDDTIHCHPRAIKAFLQFCKSEGYINEQVRFEMPKAARPDHSFLTAKQPHKAIAAADELRDKAVVLLMVDSGLRRGETIALTWGDIDLQTGLVKLPKGAKRGCWHPNKTNVSDVSAQYPSRFVGLGFRASGMGNPKFPSKALKVRWNSAKRTNTTKDIRHLVTARPHQSTALAGAEGHSYLEMTRRYFKMVDEELLAAHREHGPAIKLLGQSAETGVRHILIEFLGYSSMTL